MHKKTYPSPALNCLRQGNFADTGTMVEETQSDQRIVEKQSWLPHEMRIKTRYVSLSTLHSLWIASL